MRDFLYCCPVEQTWASVGLLIVRVATGLAFVLHGWMKVMSDGQVILTQWMGAEAPVPGWLQAVAALVEGIGGALFVLGFLTRPAAILLAIQMVVAIAIAHLPKGDPFVGAPGESSYELAAAYLADSLLLLLAGPGRFSLDAVLFGSRRVAATKA